jgi:hypothetical protein
MEELDKIDLYHGESVDIKIDEEKLYCTAFRNSGDLLLVTFYNPTTVKSYVARQMLKDIIKKVSSLEKNYGVSPTSYLNPLSLYHQINRFLFKLVQLNEHEFDLEGSKIMKKGFL